MALTVVDQGLLGTNAQYTGFKNRILNGGMVIDQRNAGASVTPVNDQFSTDRWKAGLTQASKFTLQQSTTVPTGFRNSLLATSSSAFSMAAGDNFQIKQVIEGYNTADLGFGTASASTITISFWVRSSLTGTFGGSVYNSAVNRFYPFSYTILAANTFEQKTVTIAGDTSGTWSTDNSAGIYVQFSLGAGSTYLGTAGAWTNSVILGVTGQTNLVSTNGATFYITGVQLEKGSTATSFDYRPYGTELALCQRYYHKTYPQTTAPADSAASPAYGMGAATANNSAEVFSPSIPYPVCMRATPTFTFYRTPNSTTSGQGAVYTGSWVTGTATTLAASSDNRVSVIVSKTAAFTASYSYIFEYAYSATAEL